MPDGGPGRSDPGARSYPGFEGTVRRSFLRSEPWWPSPPGAPEGAPNIVVVLCDDMGFSDIGCYGSEIATPEIDRIAEDGVRYGCFHVEPTCSPTRAALLTGKNPHSVGFGFAVTPGPADFGFPGYRWELSEDAATVAEILQDNGWATFATGKWHLSKPLSMTEGFTSTSWPTRRGFDRYYGNWACPSLFQPEELWCDDHLVDTDWYPDDYFFPDDITDQAIRMIRGLRNGHPTKPFFLYLAHSAPHAPTQAPAADVAAQRGRYDEGWDVVRERRQSRQVELGIIAPGTRLPPGDINQRKVAPWSSMSPLERELCARHMEVYAALVARIDRNLGRLRAAIEELGEWDNTIVLFMSDNGADPRGSAYGHTQYQAAGLVAGGAAADAADAARQRAVRDHAELDRIGGPRSVPHYPAGWAMASNTPFRDFKTSAYNGGHQAPLVVSWPAQLAARGVIRHQHVHVTDVLPTLLDLVGIAQPTERRGVALRAPDGVTFAPTLFDGGAPTAHTEQHTESTGNRRYYRDGWETVTSHRPLAPFDDAEWELYHVAEDPTELDDLADRHPERLAELAAAWEEAAWANQVLPMNEGSGAWTLSRSPHEEVYARPLTLHAGAPTVPMWRARLLMELRSFTVVVRLDHGDGDEGALWAHGGQAGGYGLYVDGAELRYVHNGYGDETELACGPLAAGAREVTLDVVARPGRRWDVTVLVDGERRATLDGLPLLATTAPVGGIDLGADRRSPVCWRLYEAHRHFPYSGTIRSGTITPGAWAPGEGPERLAQLRLQHSEVDL